MALLNGGLSGRLAVSEIAFLLSQFQCGITALVRQVSALLRICRRPALSRNRVVVIMAATCTAVGAIGQRSSGAIRERYVACVSYSRRRWGSAGLKGNCG